MAAAAGGGQVASFALTETEAGSDPSGLPRAVATATATSSTVSKRFITNAPLADVFMVFARTGRAAKGTADISVFAVEAGLPGVRSGPRTGRWARPGAWTAEVFFDGVRVAAPR